MLYVSNLIGTDKVEITDTVTNLVSVEDKKDLYAKYNRRVVNGLSFSPKRKSPRCEVTTPVLWVLDSIPIGQVFLLRRNVNMPFEHCVKVKQTKTSFEFYNGGDETGFFVLPRSMFIKYKNVISLDITHIDVNVAHLLKQEYNKLV